MTGLLDLYQLAEDHEHDVYWYTDENISALSVMDDKDGSCAIAINPFKLKSSADEKYKLAHELGHCECGTFYNRYSQFDLVPKHVGLTAGQSKNSSPRRSCLRLFEIVGLNPRLRKCLKSRRN